MNNTPSAVLCYVPEDDWLARSIVNSIEENEFYIQLSCLFVSDGNKLWQKIKETASEHTHLLVLLTTLSIARLWNKKDEDKIYKLNKNIIPIVHGLSADSAPQTLKKMAVYEIAERCDADSLVEHIKKLNANPDQSLISCGASDIFPKPSAAERDARFIVANCLFRNSEFKVEITHVAEECKWDRTRLDLAISWLESRGLARIDGKLIVGERPRIDCLKHIIYKNTVKGWGIAQRLSHTRINTLLLNREKFKGKIFNDKGSFAIQLTASADRSGKIALDVEPLPRSPEINKQLPFVVGKPVKLECTSMQNERRKLTSDGILVRCDINQDPVPMWLETDKVVFTDRHTSNQNTPKIALCLSEFDCLCSIDTFSLPPDTGYIKSPDTPAPEPVAMIPTAPSIEGLGSLTLKATSENCVKNRTNKRITAVLSISAAPDLKNISGWDSDVSRFLQKLTPVLEFAQGGKLFCPVTELCNDDMVETTFLCHGESSHQFMPVIQRGEDLKNLIVKVIEKQTISDDKWQGIEEALDFALSTPNYSKSRLLANMIAIEKLVKLFGEKRRKKCKLGCKIEFYMKDKNIYFTDVEYNDIKKLIDIRNDLAHECKFSGSKKELARLFALSHEVLTRIILNIFDFSGWYCSYTCENGVRNFPDCNFVNETDLNTINCLMHLHRWKNLVEQKESRVALHLPS